MSLLSIHITDVCNSACSFCVVASPFYSTNTVQFEHIIDFLKANAEGGFSAVNLHGGEPTIHPQFTQILSAIRDLGYPETHVQTNGIRLADAAYVSKLVELGVRQFIVSLHGESAEVQDPQTATPGGFERTVTGIRNARGLGIHVRTNTVISRANLHRLGAIVSLACDLGVNHINLSNLHPVGSAILSRENAMPTFAEMREHVASAVRIAVDRGRAATVEGFPLCSMPECADYQLTKYPRRIKMMTRGDVVDDYDVFMAQKMSVYGRPCDECTAKTRCVGVYPQYVQYYGWTEFQAIQPDAREHAASL